MDTSESKHEKYKSGLQSMEGAPCVVCEDGTLSISTFTKTRTQDDTTLIVRDVPALVCEDCGDVTDTRAIGARLDELLEAAVDADENTVVQSFGDSEDT